ncbi:hypothetical protein [Patulibacter sp.]|uniref:hypothetical protein n=1 Tax=Patulibacter sp. TaxID=1912859 RepID=UPI002715B3D0|nr:hypothetical protein [Patulibacter sp.]MDO9409429.1 hypothetical protein [Patulibacter sp.]
MSNRSGLLRNPRTWTVVPAAVAVTAFALGYLIWLLVGLDSGLECRETALSCGGGGWRALIGVLWTVAAVTGTIALGALLTMVVRSVLGAFAQLRD